MSCIIKNCEKNTVCKSLCSMHYQRLRRKGVLEPSWKIKDTSRMGKHTPKTAFKKGSTAWSKGLKGWVSLDHIEAIKLANTGRKPWNKGTKGIMPIPHNKIGDGITSQNRMDRVKFRKNMQKTVFERDNYTCQLCLERGGNLQVDHIKRWADYPELRFELDNCRTLCMACHYKETFNKELPEGTIWGHNLKRRIAS